MTHILVHGINYAPELIGIGKYNTEMCEHFVKSGHEVTMITAFPYYPEWKVPEKYRNKYFITERRKGVFIRRSYLYVPSKVTTLKRVLHELSFILTSFFNLVIAKKSDVLIVISPPLGLGLAACLVSRLKRIPFIFHVQDLQPDAAVDLGMIKKGLFVRFLYKIEKFIYKKASLVTTISEGMREKIILKGIDPKKVLLFLNWVNSDYIRPYKRHNIFREENGIKDKFIVLYSGNIGMKQGLDTILDVADRTRDQDDIMYLIVGNGVYRENLIRKNMKMGLNNVKFIPVQSNNMLPHMLSAADVSLVPQQRAVTDIVMPSKLTGIMASGRAVIACANRGSEVYKLITESGCGIVVEPDNPEQMLEAVMDLYRNRDKAEECGKKGRKSAVECFSKEIILKNFESKIVEEFIGRKILSENQSNS